jgi:hypothetical protein
MERSGRTIYSGRRYDFHAKLNFHIHIIEHLNAKCFEIVAWEPVSNSSTQVYVQSEAVYDRLIGAEVDACVRDFAVQCRNVHAVSISSREIITNEFRRNLAAHYILDRLSVSFNPKLTIDIGFFDKSYRLESSSRATSSAKHKIDAVPDLINQLLDFSVGSLFMEKPSNIDPSVVIRDSDFHGRLEKECATSQELELLSIINDYHDRLQHHDKSTGYLSSEVGTERNDAESGAVSPHSQVRSGGTGVVMLSAATVTAAASSVEAVNASDISHVSTTATAPLPRLKREHDTYPTVATRGAGMASLSKKDASARNLHSSQELKAPSKRTANVRGLSISNPEIFDQNPIHLHNFQKFRRDRDIFLQSLSYIHVSEYFIFQSVSKYWHTVLSAALHGERRLVVTSREFYLRESTDSNNTFSMVSHSSTKQRVSEYNEDKNVQQNIMQWGSMFVHDNIVLKLLKWNIKSIVELSLHYVILSSDCMSLFGSLNRKLKMLSLGVIKVEEIAINNITGTTRHSINANTGKGILSGSKSAPQRGKSSVMIDISQKRPFKSRYLHGLDVAKILSTCGAALQSLALSVTIGELPTGIFEHTPYLCDLKMFDTVVASSGVCYRRPAHRQGDYINMDEAVAKLVDNVTIPDLLCLMSDSPHEATLLLDKLGRIAVVSDGFVGVTGYEPKNISCAHITFLRGNMTKNDEFQKLLDGITLQKHPVESVTFLKNASGKHFLAQIILIPNIATYKGSLLNQESLSRDFLAGLAFEYEPKNVRAKIEQRNAVDVAKFKGVKNWLQAQKELSYHYLRIGIMSECF